jgi:hypothetical protein
MHRGKAGRLVTRDVPAGRLVVKGGTIEGTGELGAALRKMAREEGLTTDELLAEMLRAHVEAAQAPALLG